MEIKKYKRKLEHVNVEYFMRFQVADSVGRFAVNPLLKRTKANFFVIFSIWKIASDSCFGSFWTSFIKIV